MVHSLNQRIVGILCAIGLASVLLGGCAQPEAVSQSQLEGPWAAEFVEAIEMATSDFERETLADGVITREEYVEAHRLWMACMEGFTSSENVAVRLDERPDGLFGVAVSTSDEAILARFERWDGRCGEGTTNLVDVLYNSVATNPDNKSVEEQLFDCLVARELLPEGYEVEDFTADYGAGLYDGQEWTVPLPRNDPVFAECMVELATAK